VPGPLADVRVLDLTSVVMGPLATQILGDLGADVVTVEDIGGDTNRYMGPGPHPQLSGSALNLMRNKRNISLDLKHPDGPDIVYCQAQGWPTDSPQADQPAYDDVIQSAAGVAAAFQMRDGEPAIAPTILADKWCGMAIANGVLAALFHRERTGEGQRLEVPMVEATRAFMLAEHIAASATVPPIDRPGMPRALLPGRRPQRTKDGWVHVLPYTDEHYRRLFAVLGRAAHPRPRSGTQEYAEVAELMLSRTTAEWLEYCATNDIPAGPVRSLEEIIDELPQAEHPVAGPYRVIPPPVRFDATPFEVRHHAPLIGQHGREVLRELGYLDVEIDGLAASGALHLPV